MGAFFTPSEAHGVKRAQRSGATLIPWASEATLCAATAEQISVVANAQQEQHFLSRCWTVWVGPFQVGEMGQKYKSTLALTRRGSRDGFDQQAITGDRTTESKHFTLAARWRGVYRLASVLAWAR